MQKPNLWGGGRVAAATLISAVLVGAAPATAQTVEEALGAAYASNPNLLAERARLRATDENLAQALSGWRPTVQVTGSVGREQIGGENFTKGVYASPAQGQVRITQPVYTGGATESNVAKSKSQIQAERARLYSQEQTVLLNTAVAYFNVLRDKATLDLDIANEKVLATQLDATNDQFRVGEVTRTDVSQAESSLAGAIADRLTAGGNLNSSLASYVQQVGSPARNLVQPPLPTAVLPPSLAEAERLAATDNPDVIAAQFDETAARYQIDQTFAQLLPQVSVVGTYSVSRSSSSGGGGSNNSSSFGSSGGLSSASDRSRVDFGEVALQLTAPLYEAGQIYSQVRQAKQQASQFRSQIDIARRNAINAAATAYDSLDSARARIESLQTQIRANTIALEGVRQEQSVGSRTILDVLNAEQTLLNSQVNLVQSSRDELVAAYQELDAVGRLTARRLELNVPGYDYEANFSAVADKWIGTDIPQEGR